MLLQNDIEIYFDPIFGINNNVKLKIITMIYQIYFISENCIKDF